MEQWMEALKVPVTSLRNVRLTDPAEAQKAFEEISRVPVGGYIEIPVQVKGPDGRRYAIGLLKRIENIRKRMVADAMLGGFLTEDQQRKLDPLSNMTVTNKKTFQDGEEQWVLRADNPDLKALPIFRSWEQPKPQPVDIQQGAAVSPNPPMKA